MPEPTVTMTNIICGDAVVGRGPTLHDTDPAHPDLVVATGRCADIDQVDAAATTARRAFRTWSRTPLHERATVLVRVANLLDQRSVELGTELTREEGKTLTEGIGEVRRAADIFRYFASEADRPTAHGFASRRAGETIRLERRPLGVIGVITPFNFPVAIPAWKIAPALVYGNTVVWKPADLVPLLGFRLVEVLHEAGLPGGVLNLLLGSGVIGERLVQHREVDAVTFTGSTMVGHALMATCGPLAKPLQTEMGGKNAALVLRDADLPEAVEMVVSGAFGSTGQKCTATSRLVLEEHVADDFTALLVDRLRSWTTGDPLRSGVDAGPMISAQARERVLKHLDAGLTQGANVLAGGLPDGPLEDHDGAGWFLEPTVVELERPSPGLWSEELFGPLLTVVRARDLDHAIELANDSEFGLTASVFTRDLRSVDAVSRGLEVGILHVNSETTGAEPHVPFGGAKGSSSGPHEQGPAAQEFYTRPMTTYLRIPS